MLLNPSIHIGHSETVLEIGPGANPHPRSNVYLELKYADSKEAYAQSGYNQPIQSCKTVYYDGSIFPFENESFDYIICSHVLEHVDNVEEFINEINRVGKGRGYMEFPTIYYDYIFNIPQHLNFLNYCNGVIYYSKKNDSPLDQFSILQKAFNISLFKGYGDTIINLYKNLFVQGFEWYGDLTIKKTNYHDLLKDQVDIDKLLPEKNRNNHIGIKNAIRQLAGEVRYFIRRRWIKTNI